MTTANGAGWKELRAKRLALEESLKIGRLEKLTRLQESFFGNDVEDWLRDREVYDRIRDANGQRWLPVGRGRGRDRKGGDNWPVWQTEQELDKLRTQSRVLSDVNAFAKGYLRNQVNYIVSTGFTYQAVATREDLEGADKEAVDALVKQTQAWFDAWAAKNRWWNRERETVRRTIRDGEAFLRLYEEDDGYSCVRWVEPEQVTDPVGATREDGWSYGMHHRMDPYEDVETIEHYNVAYAGDRRDEDEQVDAAEIVHVRPLDHDVTIKRGMPFFTYDVLDALSRASKLQRNASVGAAIRAATAEIWQFATATQAQVSSLASGLREEEITNPVTGNTESVERLWPGTIRRIPAGQELVSHAADQTASYLIGAQGDLRQAAAAGAAPEYLISADASNANFASTKEAGAPYVNNAECEQKHFKASFLEVVARARRHAVEAGVLPEESLAEVQIECEPPTVVQRDVLQQSQADQIAVLTGWKSNQTTAMEWGLDPERELANREEYAERTGTGMGVDPFANPVIPGLATADGEVARQPAATTATPPADGGY